jgi:hypothetical protein
MAKPIRSDEKTLLQCRAKINKKNQREPNLATEDIGTNRRIPELHVDAPNRVTTHCTAFDETETVKVFTQSPNAEKVATTTPPRGLRYPQASPPLASKLFKVRDTAINSLKLY